MKVSFNNYFVNDLFPTAFSDHTALNKQIT